MCIYIYHDIIMTNLSAAVFLLETPKVSIESLDRS